MRTHLEFRSAALIDAPALDGKPRGQRLARWLAAELQGMGQQVAEVEPEDWGWRISMTNAAFPLWIGCGHYQEWPDGHLCFIEPSQPFVRRWLKRVPTEAVVEALATAMETALRGNDAVSELRWWTGDEAKGGGS